MGAGFDDNALLHNDNEIAVFNGREPMCYSYGGSSKGNSVECLLYFLLIFSIEGRSGFIKEEDFRLVDK